MRLTCEEITPLTTPWISMTSQGKLLTNHKSRYFMFRKELTMANRNQWIKIIFLSQYLFIAILSVKMSHVNKALQQGWTTLLASQATLETI